MNLLLAPIQAACILDACEETGNELPGAVRIELAHLSLITPTLDADCLRMTSEDLAQTIYEASEKYSIEIPDALISGIVKSFAQYPSLYSWEHDLISLLDRAQI